MNNIKTGRPTKYKPEFAERILEFFSIEEDSYKEVVNKQGTVQMIPRRMPTFERFADVIGVNSSTLYRWSTAVKKGSGEQLYPEFCMAYARAKNCQMVYVLETGFVGASRGSFLNLFMKNAHGWADKTQQVASGNLGIDLEQVNKDLEEAAVEEALKYQEMLKNGEAGNYDS